MSRGLRFREFDKKSKKWIYSKGYVTDGLLYVHYDGYLNQQDLEIDKDSVGMFTGLKDKDGVEIYEGDIVKCKDLIYKVEYDGQRVPSFHLVRESDNRRFDFGEEMDADDCLVVGNIYAL